jgi:hypothetical protein
MTISELEERSIFAFYVSEIVIPFSQVIKKKGKGEKIKYQKLSSIPVKTQRENYMLLLKEELT